MEITAKGGGFCPMGEETGVTQEIHFAGATAPQLLKPKNERKKERKAIE